MYKGNQSAPAERPLREGGGNPRRANRLPKCRSGGTGRRAGLKIPWPQGREGSTPSSGTSPSRGRPRGVEPEEPPYSNGTGGCGRRFPGSGKSCGMQRDRHGGMHARPLYDGRMFWFIRNRLSGSYRFFTFTSRFQVFGE